MGGLTDYTCTALIDQLLGRRAFESPEVLYLGLSLLPARADGRYAEPSARDYARVAVPNEPETWRTLTPGWKGNAHVMAWVPRSDWGVVRSLFLADAAEGGRVLASSDLPGPKPVLARDGPLTVPRCCLRLAIG